MDGLVKDVEEKMSVARQGGGQKAAERMRSKGKLLPRERSATFFGISNLLTTRPFVQIESPT
jgi:acetyl-CoA carboxylase carboxyltransferase component